MALTVDGGDIDAISGATITSKAVTVSIDEGLKKLMEIVNE
ncbi:MAG: FMN-binding protein [Candidatus Latescibacteria bacterium]|nr:FMN-binding protein [Candidatus Latescibacterota bacterium]